MKKVVQFMVGILLFGSTVFSAPASFTALYVFGDGISTTTNNPLAGQYYYGLRRSNGRVWVEVLAQRQGLGANSTTNVNWSNSTNNWSYYGQYSFNLVTNINNFQKPSDAATALFVIWVNNADFVGYMGSIYPSTNIVTWTNAVNQSLSNHWNIITNLYYAKGARTLIMPDAVDITEIPQYDTYPPATKIFVRQRVIDFNTAFTAILNQAEASLPGITIYEPDFYVLLNKMLTNAAAYGVTNVLSDGQSIDVIEDSLANKSLSGPGTNYIFWDATDPTAKVHMWMANLAQQLISPVQISDIASVNGSSELDLANVPIGQDGLVLGSTDLGSGIWTTNASFISSNATQTVLVPAYGPQCFYRLSFPFSWTWP